MSTRLELQNGTLQSLMGGHGLKPYTLLRQGVMGTGDETTRIFFEGTKVVCKLAYRGTDLQKNFIKAGIECARSNPTPKPLRAAVWGLPRPCSYLEESCSRVCAVGNMSRLYINSSLADEAYFRAHC